LNANEDCLFLNLKSEYGFEVKGVVKKVAAFHLRKKIIAK